jgi:NADPH:quinone reductase-like Zn-dependent oxidoreductase
LSFCRGTYRLTPTLPATPGAECVGRVTAVGVGVGDIRVGDLVSNMQRENWTQRRRIKTEDAVPLPAGLDPAQAAMLRINPATAQLLLEDHVDLKPGDWVIQDVANSAVGRHLIVLARSRGIRTVNVVRRDDVGAELKALGADVVLADGPDLAARAGDAVGGDAPIRLGIDAVSGSACRRIADCVGETGVVVNYGSMSGEDPQISRGALGRGITITGFNLGRGLAKRTNAAVRSLYAELAAKLRDGALRAPVEATYPIEDIKTALAHAQRGGRNGKVLVLPNGPLPGSSA